MRWFERRVHYTIRLFYMAYLAWEPERHLISFHSTATQTEVLIQGEMHPRSLLQCLWYDKAVTQTKKKDEYDFIVIWYCLCHTTSCPLLNITHKWVISRLKLKAISCTPGLLRELKCHSFHKVVIYSVCQSKTLVQPTAAGAALTVFLQVTTIIHST